MESKTQIVFSKTIALSLINQGFTVVDININKQDNKPTYIFDNSAEFQKKFIQLIYNRQALQIKLRRDEIELIIKSLASQLTISKMESDKIESEKVNNLIDILSSLLKDNTKVFDSNDN